MNTKAKENQEVVAALKSVIEKLDEHEKDALTNYIAMTLDREDKLQETQLLLAKRMEGLAIRLKELEEL